MILMSRQNEIILRVSKLVIYLICMHPCRKRIGELISRSHSCLANSFCLKKKFNRRKIRPTCGQFFLCSKVSVIWMDLLTAKSVEILFTRSFLEQKINQLNRSFNLLSPNFRIHILKTVFYLSRIVLLRRSCVNVKDLFLNLF